MKMSIFVTKNSQLLCRHVIAIMTEDIEPYFLLIGPAICNKPCLNCLQFSASSIAHHTDLIIPHSKHNVVIGMYRPYCHLRTSVKTNPDNFSQTTEFQLVTKQQQKRNEKVKLVEIISR